VIPPLCLAVPGKVVSLDSSKQEATVYYYDGSRRQASTIGLAPKINDYVLVQAGLVVQTIPEQEAQESIEAWRELDKA